VIFQKAKPFNYLFSPLLNQSIFAYVDFTKQLEIFKTKLYSNWLNKSKTIYYFLKTSTFRCMNIECLSIPIKGTNF